MQEVVLQVKEAEKKALEIKKAAFQEAKQMAIDAQNEGTQLLENRRSAAASKASALLEQAKEQADQEMAKQKQLSTEKCKGLVELAQSRMDQAAGFIVERIVDGA